MSSISNADKQANWEIGKLRSGASGSLSPEEASYLLLGCLQVFHTSMTDDFIATLGANHDTQAVPVVGAKLRSINHRLLEAFFGNVRQATGKWVFKGYRWHAYTYDYEMAHTRQAAFELYWHQSVVPFYIYLELEDLLFDCTAHSLPNVAEFNSDIYVFPHDTSWLFSTTHENSIGPFFALRSE